MRPRERAMVFCVSTLYSAIGPASEQIPQRQPDNAYQRERPPRNEERDARAAWLPNFATTLSHNTRFRIHPLTSPDTHRRIVA